VQRHPQVVPLGEPSDHGEAHVSHGVVVEPERPREPAVELGEAVRGEPDAAVLDPDQHAALLGEVGADPHLLVRRRVAGGVVEQLREHPGEVVGGEAHHAQRHHPADPDPGVLVDRGHRPAHGVEDRDGVAAALAGVAVGEHAQVLGVAAQPRGQVVEPVQLAQPRAVLLLALQLLELGQQGVDQVEITQGDARADVDERLVPGGLGPRARSGLDDLRRGMSGWVQQVRRDHARAVEQYT
jgi:hypothetical protein